MLKKIKLLKFTALLIAALMLFSVVPVGVSAKSESKHEYSGLISRMDKFLNYCSDANQANLFYYKYKGGTKPYFGDIYDFLKYCNLISITDSEKSELLFEEMETTGAPYQYYIIKWSDISKQEVEAAVKKYCDEASIEYVDWMVDALWSDDPLVVIDTLMYPDYVINTNKYESSEPKVSHYSGGYSDFYYYTYIEYSSHQLLNTSVEVLDGWGNSDEYWLDYYSFIQYLNTDEVQNDPIYGYDANMMTYVNTFSNEVLLAELDRRVELYANRVANAETGDDTGVRVVFLASAAVICAVIPAMVEVKRRRREE